MIINTDLVIGETDTKPQVMSVESFDSVELTFQGGHYPPLIVRDQKVGEMIADCWGAKISVWVPRAD